MLGIKKIDIFVLKKFLVMFVACFLVCLFVFMMQFIWQYINQLVGKGLTADVLAQFVWYMGLSLVPMALPMAILLTSLISFGNMGEQLELTAMKAAGIPLLRVMRPLIIVCAILMGVSFYFQNVVGPNAQMQLQRLLLAMKETSPALQIPEGVFYNGITNVNLYVERKNPKTGMLYNVMIYKMDQGIDNAQIVVADSAKIETTADKHFLRLSIYNGEEFENLQSGSTPMLSNTQVPYDRESFQYKIFLIEYDSEFEKKNEEDLRNLPDAKTLDKLTADADSMTRLIDSIGYQTYLALSARYLQSGYMSKKDSALAQRIAARTNIDTLLEQASPDQRLRIMQAAAGAVSNMVVELEDDSSVSHDFFWTIRKHHIKWHDRFASSLACLFFFFIGSPLGAIIRKGGLGISTIVSILIFLVYYLVGISGMKMARDGSIEIIAGMWISTLIMTPLGVFLTYKANKDSTVFNAEYYWMLIKDFLGIRQKRKLQRKEIIIYQPDYDEAIEQLHELTAQCQALRSSLRLKRPANYIQMFFTPARPNKVADMAQSLEQLVQSLSNSEDARLVSQLNDYPIPYQNAHTSPTTNKWLNIAIGTLLPVGLLVWLRTSIFRNKLRKDISQIISTNKKIEYWIGTKLPHEQ